MPGGCPARGRHVAGARGSIALVRLRRNIRAQGQQSPSCYWHKQICLLVTLMLKSGGLGTCCDLGTCWELSTHLHTQLGLCQRPACLSLLCRYSRNGEGHTESQNHRMVGVGRDLCGSSSPTLLPKQGHLQQAAQNRVQASLEYLQRRRLHSLPGQPVPVLCHPQREEVLPHVRTELPVLQFVPIAPCPVTGHH